MNRLAPYRGSLLRLALMNALLVGFVALALVSFDRPRHDRGGATFTVDSGRQVVGSALAVPAEDATALSDQRLVKALAELTDAEVRLAEVAVERAKHPAVRGFAADLAAQQHTAQNELETLAVRIGLLLPTGDPSAPGAETVMLAAGDAFDHAFLDWAVESHARALKLAETAAAQAHDAQLRRAAGRMLPQLKAQHEQARRLRRALY